MDEELKLHLDGMEARLLGQLNKQTERILDRLTKLEGEVRDLRTEHSVTRDIVLKLPGVVLGALEEPLLKRIRATEGRLDKLEGEN